MLLLLISVLDVIFAPRGTGAQSVTQPDAHVTVSEGSPLELRCNYSYSGTPYLYWYVQYPSQGLQLLLRYFSGDTLVKGIRGFEAEFRKTETSFHLRKPSARGNDAAKYFCAASDTVSGTAGGAEHKPPETLGLLVTQELRRVFQALFFSEGKQGRTGWALGKSRPLSSCLNSHAVLHSDRLCSRSRSSDEFLQDRRTPPSPHPTPTLSVSLSVRVPKQKRQEHFYFKKIISSIHEGH
uniref:Ig-like domain-containing protein n=1 Tax=Ursus maritimus TaxID=29073 RepID=A0A452VKU6_URSMA